MPKGTPTEETEDAAGLTVQQRRLLMLLGSGKTLKEACELEELDRRVVNRWMREPAFLAAFDDLFSLQDLANLKKTLDLAALSAVEVYEDAIKESTKKIKAEVLCPHCSKTHTVFVDVEDWKSRLHAADILLKISGILIERRQEKIDMNIKSQVSLGPMESLEILAWKSGVPIPPAREQWFRDNGFIEGEQPRKALPPGQTVDAEFREVPDA